MNKINNEDILNQMNETSMEIPLSDEDYRKLLNHFKNDELNQFYLYIIQKVLEIKKF